MVSVFIDQWFATRASVATFHSISSCAALGAASNAVLTVGGTFSISKLLPASIPSRRIWARIGSSVRWGGFTLSSSVAYAKYWPPGMVSTWTLGGVFMSTLGSIFAVGGAGALPHSESTVTFMPAWILRTAS